MPWLDLLNDDPKDVREASLASRDVLSEV